MNVQESIDTFPLQVIEFLRSFSSFLPKLVFRIRGVKILHRPTLIL